MSKYHVLPINDSDEHEESTTCKCNPKIEFVNGDMIIIHNSFDKRELKPIIDENSKDLLKIYNDGNCNKEDIEELLLTAIEDEEYEVAISIRDVLNIISSDNEKRAQEKNI